MSRYSDESYVTLATNDNYAIGALTLARSLRHAQTSRSLTVMISNEVSHNVRAQLNDTFDHVIIVDLFDSNDNINLALLKRPELGVTFTKLHCWRLTQFKKCVFLDADTLVLTNVDDLFERPELSAAADCGWPDCFNSGVFVYVPSEQTYTRLIKFATEQGSFDGGDQGLLNLFFADWSTGDASRRLPFVYNMTTNVSYGYAPAYNQFKNNVKIVHFIGSLKPWYSQFNVETRSVVGNVTNNEHEHLNAWWSMFVDHVLPYLDHELKSRIDVQLVGQQQKHVVASQPSAQISFHDNQPSSSVCQETPTYVTGSVSSGGVVVGSEQHQNLWEQGQIEYTGRDSFSNIQAHLDAQLQKK